MTNVIIVDDQNMSRQLFESIIKSSENYQLLFALDKPDFLDVYLSKYNVDLIIMDINMPEMNGIETAKKIFDKLDRRIPLLFITEFSDKSVIMQCLSLNVSGYIVRPYKPDFVLSEIKRIIG